MVTDLDDTHRKNPKIAIKDSMSLPMSHITLDESSTSDDPTKTSNNPARFISPPPFCTKKNQTVLTK